MYPMRGERAILSGIGVDCFWPMREERGVWFMGGVNAVAQDCKLQGLVRG
jgi:hypothetical protein